MIDIFEYFDALILAVIFIVIGASVAVAYALGSRSMIGRNQLKPNCSTREEAKTERHDHAEAQESKA
ncbi:hypothetical protein CCR94_07740 [Rhodoblastus sphagnicola]|uniref:Uncharacterized protein n=1 Tax=Rhodoblastus sphagnicola TaxID=333368 RepID=A0A2S6NBE5_9HYPH|nr:hypothetical protein [Rhodoblastus sphagnicola]MBB4201097.1 phosphotransferase system glucose/maltose/N-acetylglucosamine-specific IIC component [Rhodoblastus sphagnicola]PPQ31938.1 hypothetical protein CCR94_07740 [Rhodoblastus sphagnicola]